MPAKKLSPQKIILALLYIVCLAIPFVDLDLGDTFSTILSGLGIAAWVFFVLFISMAFYVMLRRMQS
jgi:hypothetical protein